MLGDISLGKDPVKEDLADDDFVFDDAIKQQIEDMRRDFAHINHKAKKALEKMGIKGVEMKKYMSDPRNFTPSEWETLSQAHEDSQHLKDELYKALGYVPKKKKQKKSADQKLEEELNLEQKKVKLRKKTQKKSQQDSKTKRRRKKMVGFKKGWMQMD